MQVSKELQINKPFFISEKRKMNQEYQKIDDESLKRSYFHRTRTRTEINNTLDYDFPYHTSVDILKRHSEGFWNKENTDLFNHFHRMFFKNKYFFDKKLEKLRKALILISEVKNDRNLFSETPLQMKKFIIEKNFLDIKIYEELLRKYEEEKTLEFSSPSKANKIQEVIKIIDMNSSKLENQSSQLNLLEENFLVSVMEKANNYGLKSLNPKEIIDFKRIIEKRKSILQVLNKEIGLNWGNNLANGHFRTKTMMNTTIITESNETKDENERNNEKIKRLDQWKNIRSEGVEYHHLGNSDKSERNKQEKKTNSFLSMFKKLKEKKKKKFQKKMLKSFKALENWF